MPSLIPKRKYLTYREVGRIIGNISRELVPPPTLIVAIGRGGIIPAAMLAYYIGRPKIEVIYATSYDNEERGTLGVAWPSGITIGGIRSQGSNILIIDDITDSGITMATFKEQFPNARTAVVVHKNCSLFTPDLHGPTEKEEIWIVFPWERKR